MGKPGGFFKRLKAKQKNADNRKKRGTTGASKAERRRKREVQTEFYAAKREVRQLDNISSSSDDDVAAADEALLDSDEERLLRLRSALGVAAAPPSTDQRRPRLPKLEAVGGSSNESDSSESDVVDDEEDELLGAVSDAEGGEEEAEESADFDDEGDDDDGDDFDDEEEEGDDDEGDDDDGNPEGLPEMEVDEALLLQQAADDDDFVFEHEEAEEEEELGDAEEEQEEGEDEDAEEEEDSESVPGVDDDDGEDGDDVFVDEAPYQRDEDDDDDDFGDDDDDDHLRGNRQAARPKATKGKKPAPSKQREQRLILPHFDFSTSDASALKGVVDASDPWLLKYHLDTHGDIDASQPLDVLAAAAAGDENDDEAAGGTGDTARVAKKKRQDASTATSRGRIDAVRRAYGALLDANVSIKASAKARAHAPKLLSPLRAEANDSVPPPFVNETLWANWVAFRRERSLPVMTAAMRAKFGLFATYGDVLDNTTTLASSEEELQLIVLHLLNHWFKAKAVMLAHNVMRKNRKAATQAAGGSGGEDDEYEEEEEEEYRDRGFGKTRLLLVLPMRNAALNAVRIMCALLGADPFEQHKFDIFERDFTEVEEMMDPTFRRRPKDYQKLFEGNIDDMFCFGASLRADGLSLYSHVLNSDILICSPVGLRRRLMKNADCTVALSSIEVCAVHDAHVIMMQNWQQMEAVFKLLNKRPKDTTEGLSEINRIYGWALEGHSGRHRQTIINSEIANATINATARTFVNNSGRFVLTQTKFRGVLPDIAFAIRQHFVRFDVDSVADVDAARFEFFTKTIFPSKIQPLVDRNVRTIIFAPSYFDFIRVRNFLHAEHRESFAELSEYTSLKAQRQALGQFSDGERTILVTTERFYFFKRYFVKLAEVLVMYSPPLFPNFYGQLIGKLNHTSPNCSVLTTFCRFDALELQRIVGSDRATQLLTRDASAFAFVTGS